MNEVMVHGTYICADNNNKQTSDAQQLVLFRLAPELKAIGVNYWLRNAAGSQTYTLISQYGDASSDMATSTYGIRRCSQSDDFGFKCKGGEKDG